MTQTPQLHDPADAAPADVPIPAVPSGREVAGRAWRAGRVWLVVAALAAALVSLVLFRPSTPGGTLRPDSPRPAGAMAVAEVLRQHGVTIHQADSLDRALELVQQHPDATLLFHDPQQLLPEDGLTRLAEQTDPAQRVLVAPTLTQVRSLAQGVTTGPLLDETDVPLTTGTECALPVAREAGSMTGSARLYRGGSGCFNGISSPPGDVDPAHALVKTDGGTWVIGTPQVLANDTAADHGHPVISLWTLGQGQELIWYLPSLADVPVSQTPSDPTDLLPEWVSPVIWWLVICSLILMLWRGRRHGPLSIEPLPVVVPSSETAVGRARLYQSTGQIAAASRSLHQATRLRLARTLRLGRGATTPGISQAAAQLTGQHPSTIAQLLDETTVSSTTDLVDRSRALQQLEHSVHRALGGNTPPSAGPTPSDDEPSTQDPRGPETTP